MTDSEPPACGCRYSRADAVKIFKIACSARGSVRQTDHAKNRLAQYNATMEDVIRLVKKGQILREPEQHIKSGAWLHRIEDATNEGIRAAEFEIMSETSIRLVTVIK